MRNPEKPNVLHACEAGIASLEGIHQPLRQPDLESPAASIGRDTPVRISFSPPTPSIPLDTSSPLLGRPLQGRETLPSHPASSRCTVKGCIFPAPPELWACACTISFSTSTPVHSNPRSRHSCFWKGQSMDCRMMSPMIHVRGTVIDRRWSGRRS